MTQFPTPASPPVPSLRSLSRRSLFALGAAAGALPHVALAAPASESGPTFGPKKRLAVAKFDAISTFVNAYGASDVGRGLAAELATALVETDQFMVVERTEVAQALDEQELGARGATTAETAAKAGQLLGAQILVLGSVTSFDQQARGGGVTLGFGNLDLGGALGRRTLRGTLGVDLRLMDTTSGQLIAARTFHVELKQTAGSFDLIGHGATLSREGFKGTVLGEAARDAIGQAAGFVVEALRNVAWQGRISEVDGDQVYIAAGAWAGVRVGDRLQISRVAKRITDPESGEVLGGVEQQLGLVQVGVVKDRFCVAAMLANFQPQRGDVVRYA